MDVTPAFHRRLLGTDDPISFARVLGIVGLFWVLDVATRRATSANPVVDDVGASLAWWAFRSNPTAWMALALGVAALLIGPGTRSRALGGWDQLENGASLRWFAMPIVVLSVWYHAFYSYNFFLDDWHHLDRLVIIGLAIAVWWHPLFLLPLVLVARVVDTQFLVPFIPSPGKGIGELLLMCLLVLSAAFVAFTLHGDRRTSGWILVLGALVASHFFEPGRLKLSLRWATNSDLSEFARASYTAGWRGAGDGTWSDSLASLVDTLHVPIIAGTLLLEVGALIAVANHRLLRWWLGGWILLHATIFAMSGFWLFEWVAVEVLLLTLLVGRNMRESLRENDTPARALLAVGLVAIGGLIFHPPRLAWLDAPVSYGYEIEAIGAGGIRYRVPMSEFGPFSEDILFGFVGFQQKPDAVFGYGGVNSVWLIDRLRDVSTFDDLDAVEASFDDTPDEIRASSEELIVRWLEHTNDDRRSTWFLIRPISRYWTSVRTPRYEGAEPLVAVEVIRVRSIHHPEQRFERRSVLTVEWADGQARVTERVDDSG